jgi:hypothetical protein
VAKLFQPVLFSSRFGVFAKDFDNADLVEPILNCDLKLFVDPLLLQDSSNRHIRKDAFEQLKLNYSNIIKLVAESNVPGDLAWRTAVKKLNLSERPETGLGFGGASTSGNSRPTSLRETIIKTVKEITDLGVKNPEIVSLIGVFEDGVGADTISDLTTNFIFPTLCQITNEFCKKHKIPVKKFHGYPADLPSNPMRNGAPIIFVPRDIVRDLPIAADWSDVSKSLLTNRTIRDEFNSLLGPIAQATIADRKRALKKVALSSATKILTMLDSLIGSSEHYDPNDDILNYYALRKILTSNLSEYKGKLKKPDAKNGSELLKVTLDIVNNFKWMVEVGGLWELLWVKNNPKLERASQLLFYGIADAYCKANDIDVSPETNMGGGAVDFKFSQGYNKRVVVELKRSKGAVETGYKNQLEIYKTASQTEHGIFVVVNVGGIGGKLKKIQKIQNDLRAAGKKVSEIVVIDAMKRKSASKKN